jgi:hypothetical protein
MFKAAEKPFHQAINPVCAFSTQTLFHFHDRQMLSVFMAGSLAAPIRVMEQARFRLSAPLRPVGKKAICNALTHNEARMWSTQRTQERQPSPPLAANKSITTAIYSQPSSVQMQAISPRDGRCCLWSL